MGEVTDKSASAEKVPAAWPEWLVDRVAEAIRNDMHSLIDGTWVDLHDDRKRPWREDAHRALAAIPYEMFQLSGISGELDARCNGGAA